jgi:virulence-associated protein VagC
MVSKSNSKPLIKRLEGFHGISPRFKKVSFPEPGKIQITLEDGRVIISPLSKFPSLKKLSPEKRKKMSFIDNRKGLWFDDCDEVYHIQDFLGRETDYSAD